MFIGHIKAKYALISDLTRPGPTRPDPARPGPARPGPTMTLFGSLYLSNQLE